MLATRTTRSFLALAAAAVLATSLAACSPGAAPNTGGDRNASTGQGGGSSSVSAERDAYDLELAQCLRDRGLEVKDPQPGQGIQENSTEVRNAVPACMDEIGQPPVAEGYDEAEVLEVWLAEAKCFRELGYDVEEPALGKAYTVPSDASEAEVAQCISVTP